VARDPTITDFAAECQRLQAALRLAERDRQLLGYEIHDSLLQDLTAAALLLEGAEPKFTTAAGKEGFAAGLRMVRESIAAARQIIAGAVQSDDQRSGLVAELQRVIERFRTDHALPVTFEVICEIPALPATIQRQLLRISQESLFNVSKHAQATEALVRLAMREGKLNLTIADNGVGFDPAQVPVDHFGLAGIRARCQMIGADLVFDTAPHHGTKVVVELPLPPP